MARPTSKVPTKKDQDRPSHEELDNDIAVYLASGKTIEVIESRPASPVSKASQTAIF